MTGPDDNRPGDTDPPNAARKGLTGRSLNSLLWLFAGGGMEAILKIVVLLILARLLLPEEFGIVSAALTIVALAETLGRVGVAPSIIQVKELTRDHVATGFVTTVATGALMAGIVYLLAGPIAALYQIPEVEPLIEAFSVLFIIKGLGLVSEAMLQRNMRFRELAVIRLLSYFLGYGTVAVTMALLGYGVWALIVAQIAQATLQTVIYLIFARRGLAVGFNWPVFLTMLQFGLGITLSRVGNYLSQNADYFIVGRFLGPEALGYYSRAYLLLKQAAHLVGDAGDQVLFPTLASIQDDKKRLERALNLALSLTAMTQIPVTALLVVAAPEIILTLMGPQWDQAVLPFQILISVMFFRTGYRFVNSILRAAGRVYIAALWQWGYAAMVIAGAWVGQAFDLWGVATGVSGAVVFCHLSGLMLVKRFVGVGSGKSLARLVAYTLFAGLIAAAFIGLKMGLVALGLASGWILLLMVVVFVAVYGVLFTVMPTLFGEEGEVLKDQTLKAVRRRLGKKK